MSDPLFEGDDANTPLTEEEKGELIPSYVTLRSELNEAEQINIDQGSEWAFGRKRDVLDDGFLRELHRRMFGEVWEWAGRFRTSERNIGVDAYRIGMDLRQLVDDTRYQVKHATCPVDEIAVRFTTGWSLSTPSRTATAGMRLVREWNGRLSGWTGLRLPS